MFKHNSKEIINYNFNLEGQNIILDKIKTINPLDKEKNRIRCCLIKKKYHIRGEIIIKYIKENNKKLFNIFFVQIMKEMMKLVIKILQILIKL